MSNSKNGFAGVIITCLVLMTATPSFCGDLLDLHLNITPVEFIQYGGFNGIGFLYFHLTSPDRRISDGRVVYVYFLETTDTFSKDSNKIVFPYVYIMKLSSIELMYDDIVIFKGVNDSGFPFLGSIKNYSDPAKRRVSLTIEGVSPLVIQDLLSQQAREFKSKYLQYVYLGWGPYLYKGKTMHKEQ